MSSSENGVSNAIPKFDCHSDPATLGPRWKRWLTSFELFADGKGLIITEGTNAVTKQRRRARRCWTRSEGHHGEKIKNGSFASDLRFVHISRYAIKIPGEIVWYGHYRSSSAFKGHNMRCSFEIFLWKGGRNRRLLLASQNCYFLCRRDNFGIEATRYVSTHRSYMCLKCLILNVSFSLALFSPQIFFPGTLTCAWRILIFPSKIICNLFWFSRRSWRPRQMWNPPPLTCCCWGQQQVSGGFLVIFFRMNSVLSVRYVLYDLLGIMKNLAQKV